MIDDGELDWKVIAIHSQDELAPKLNDICDVEQYCPGVVSGKFTTTSTLLYSTMLRNAVYKTDLFI